MIPKQLFITCKDKNDLHEDFVKNIDKLREESVGCELKIIDNNDFEQYLDTIDNPKIKKAYYKLNKGAGALIGDFVRYVMMYYEGGAYIDMKSGFRKPLNEIINTDEDLVLYYWHTYSELVQFFLASVPKHPFYKALLDELCEDIDNYKPTFNSNKANVLKLSGPRLISRVFNKFFTEENKPTVRDFKKKGNDLIYSRVPKHGSKMDNSYSRFKGSIVLK